jgi:hypothetical protein
MGPCSLLLPCHDGLALLLLEQEASETYLKGILGFETRPLVSTDYVNDARSGIVDAACTQVGSGLCAVSACARGRPGQPNSLLARVLMVECMADVSESCTFSSRWLYLRHVCRLVVLVVETVCMRHAGAACCMHTCS